ncbi:MAG: hypothetical protein Q9212_002925 [Teloschistes hypoglaucus]
MGGVSSKVARSTASASAVRKYPSRTPATNPTTNAAPSQPPPSAEQPTAPGPTVHPPTQASNSRDEAINLDASDPHFARSLRSLGPVQPSSTFSNSSTFDPSSPSSPNTRQQQQQQIFPNPALNPALQVLSRREELAREAEADFSRIRDQGQGRKFLDVVKIREVLMMRDEKRIPEAEIEKRLGLSKGMVGRLGKRGVVGEAGLGKGEIERVDL